MAVHCHCSHITGLPSRVHSSASPEWQPVSHTTGLAQQLTLADAPSFSCLQCLCVGLVWFVITLVACGATCLVCHSLSSQLRSARLTHNSQPKIRSSTYIIEVPR